MLLIIRDSSRVCWCSWGLSCVCQLLSKYIGIINLPLRECQSWFVLLLFCFVVSGPHNNRSHVQLYKDLIQLWIQTVAYIQSFNQIQTSVCDCITYFNCLLSVAVSVIPFTIISCGSTSDSILTTTSPPTPEYTYLHYTLTTSHIADIATMPQPTPAETEAHQRLLDTLDIAQIPRPFRNPNWKPSQRRNKNVKQIISENTRKEASVMATQANSGATTPFPAPGTASTDGSQTPAEGATPGGGSNIAQAAQNLPALVLEKNARAMFPSGPAVTYTNIESAPSLHPAQQKRYCDITGLPAAYTDPKTRLRYHDREVFGVIRTLAQGVPESYLEARGAQVVLK